MKLSNSPILYLVNIDSIRRCGYPKDHGRILKAIGVHEVVNPEAVSATGRACRLARQDVIDYPSLLPEYSVIEIAAPEQFTGKSLRELAPRNTREFN